MPLISSQENVGFDRCVFIGIYGGLLDDTWVWQHSMIACAVRFMDDWVKRKLESGDFEKILLVLTVETFQISSDLIRFPGELWLLVVALGHAALSSAAPGDVKTTRDWIFWLSKTFGSFWFTCRFNQINSWNGNCAEQTEHMDMVSLVNFVVDLALPISGLCIWFRATESTHLRAGAGTGSIGKRLLRVEISMVVTVVMVKYGKQNSLK